MSIPASTKTWTISANNRITFVSLNDTMATYLYGIKTFLIGHGYTVKYTCDGTTGPTSSSDHTDRWASKANCTTRGAASGNAQSFCVLTALSGCDITLAYQGASDDICRISFSPSGVVLPAGTANQQPTATDEQVISSAQTVIANTASGDRLWFGWVDSTSKLCRFAVARSGLFVGITWGVELVTSTAAGTVTFPSTSVGWCITPGNHPSPGTSYSSTYGAVASVTVASINYSLQLGGGIETPLGATSSMSGVNCELQGASGPLALDLSWWSATAGARGKLGNRIDWYYSADQQPNGTTTADLKWVMINGSTGAQVGSLFPWDGATTPILT